MEDQEKIIEVIIRPLFNVGHTVRLMAKVKLPDGSVVDHAIESSTPQKELRLELTNLQEVLIRGKVTSLVQYDQDQSAVVSAPMPEQEAEGKGTKSRPLSEAEGQSKAHEDHHTKTVTASAKR